MGRGGRGGEPGVIGIGREDPPTLPPQEGQRETLSQMCDGLYPPSIYAPSSRLRMLTLSWRQGRKGQGSKLTLTR